MFLNAGLLSKSLRRGALMCAIGVFSLTGTTLPANAQVGAAAAIGTAAFISEELKQRIEEINELINAATGGAQAVLRETDVRLRALLVEFDKTIGNRINESASRLDLSQQTFLRGVQDTLDQTENAIQTLRAGATQDAIVLLKEADISAYNALYSLPCRDKIPRILLSTPDVIRVSGDDHEVVLRGNFLNLGDTPPVITLDGKQMVVSEIDDTSIRFVVPSAIAGADTQSKRIVSFEVNGLTQQKATNLWVYCPEWRSDYVQPQRVSFTVLPPVRHTITVRITGSLLVKEPVPNVINGENVQLSGGCSSNYPGAGTHRASLPDIKLSNVRIQRNSQICGTSIANPVYEPGVSKEVVVPYHVRGCGRGRAGDCKGRGRGNYTIWADGVREVVQKLPEVVQTHVLMNGGTVSAELPDSDNPTKKAIWHVKIVSQEGNSTPLNVELTADRQAYGGYSAAPGTLGGRVVISVPVASN